MFTLVAFVVVALVLVPAIRMDLERTVERQRLRRLAGTTGRRGAFTSIRLVVDTRQFVEALTRATAAAQEFGAALRKVNETMQQTDYRLVERMREEIRKAGPL